MTKKPQIPQYPDPNWILRAAKENEASADFLYNESIKFMCSENERERFVSVAYSMSAIVLYAFSIELGLKALLSFEGKKEIKEHDLRKLFFMLSQEARNEVIGTLPEERFKIHFDKYLEENKHNFVDWRYYYEKTTIASSDFLKAFAQAIIDVADSK